MCFCFLPSLIKGLFLVLVSQKLAGWKSKGYTMAAVAMGGNKFVRRIIVVLIIVVLIFAQG